MSLTQFAKRPDNGGSIGRPVNVKVNIFPVTGLNDVPVYQYDVTFTPEIPPPMARRAWKVFEIEAKSKISSKCLMAFDGRKNAFSVMDIPTQSMELSVPKEDDVYIPPLTGGDQGGGGGGRGGRGGFRGGRGGGRGRGGPSGPTRVVIPVPPPSGQIRREKIKIHMRRVAQINMHDLLLFTKGQGPETESVLHATTALSVLIRHVPSMLFVPVGTNFFTFDDRIPISGGLEIWRGYHQSIRSMMAGHLGINIDIASTVFRKGEVSVIDYLLDVLEVNDPEALVRIPRLQERIASELKGVNVVTIHRGDIRQRFKIARVSRESARDFKFDHEDGKMSVEQYFLKQFNMRLQFPRLPLALKGNGKTAFPLECLKIAPAQRFMKRLSGQQTSDMIRATVQRPKDRERTIQQAADRVLRYKDNDHLKSFGMQVSPQMMNVGARILPAPNLVFRDNRTLSGQEGAWNLRNTKLVNAPALVSAAFVCFVRVDQTQAKATRDALFSKWSQVGMNIQCKSAPVFIANPNVNDNIFNTMRAAFSEAGKVFNRRAQIIFCVIDSDPKDVYEQIKRITINKAGVVTQCMQFRHLRNPGDIKDQYAANVALKVNIKIGGATNHVDKLPSFDRPTMLMGADVTHAASGSMAPSIAAVVASMDKHATSYHTSIRAQGVRTEVIADMDNIMGGFLDAFRAANKTYPQRIFFFRDGVASGQFAEVESKEVRAIKAALAKRNIQCNLTFVIVQKRHHIRLFPMDERNMDRSGNCMPGTVVSTQITHPSEFQFILQSHAGIQGMSRPTIYHVVFDENKMTSDSMQQLCFNLCFLAGRATRSISISTPAYLAHIAAFKARLLLTDGSDGGSVMSGGSGESGYNFLAVSNELTGKMFYM